MKPFAGCSSPLFAFQVGVKKKLCAPQNFGVDFLKNLVEFLKKVVRLFLSHRKCCLCCMSCLQDQPRFYKRQLLQLWQLFVGKSPTTWLKPHRECCLCCMGCLQNQPRFFKRQLLQLWQLFCRQESDNEDFALIVTVPSCFFDYINFGNDFLKNLVRFFFFGFPFAFPMLFRTFAAWNTCFAF